MNSGAANQVRSTIGLTMVGEVVQAATLTRGDCRSETGPAGRLPYIAFLVALALGLSLASLGDWAILTPDSLTYLGTARHLRETGQWPARRLMHPPGFPLAISPFVDADHPLPFSAIRVLNSLAFASSCVLTLLLARRHLGPRWGLAAACLTAASPLLLQQAATILSESLFIPLALASLWMVDRWASNHSPRAAEIIGAAAIAAAAAIVRSIGAVLGPIAALALLLQPGPPLRTRLARTALFSLVFAPPLLAWTARQSAYAPAYGYASIWTQPRASERTDSRGIMLQLQRLATFGPLRVEDVARAVLPQTVLWRGFQAPWRGPTVWITGGGLFLVAFLRSFGRGHWVDRYVVATLLLLCLWPWDEKERLVAPLVPIFLIYGVGVARRWCEVARPRSSVRWSAYAAVAALTALDAAEFAVQQSRMDGRRQRCEREVATMREMAACLAGNLPPSAPLICIMSRQGEARILAAGAAYLARRPIDAFLDFPSAAQLEVGGAENLLVHRTLFEAPALRDYERRSPIGGEFVLMTAPSANRRLPGTSAGTGPGTGS